MGEVNGGLAGNGAMRLRKNKAFCAIPGGLPVCGTVRAKTFYFLAGVW